jgi:sporulation-control protein spo0M
MAVAYAGSGHGCQDTDAIQQQRRLMARLRLNGTQHLKGGETARQMKNGRIGIDAGSAMRLARQRYQRQLYPDQ